MPMVTLTRYGECPKITKWKYARTPITVTIQNKSSLEKHLRIRGSRKAFRLKVGDAVLVDKLTLLRDYRTEDYFKRCGLEMRG